VALPFLVEAIRSGIDLGQAGEASVVPYLRMIIGGVGGLMLLVGYRTRLAATVLMIWSVALGFGPHSPSSFLGIGTEHFTAVIYNLFQKNGGPLSGFFKDISVAGALLMLVAYGAGELSLDARARARRGAEPGHLRAAGVKKNA
jgi:uncharacterized membrane protein YphA (DoxX/SURF4 family)